MRMVIAIYGLRPHDRLHAVRPALARTRTVDIIREYPTALRTLLEACGAEHGPVDRQSARFRVFFHDLLDDLRQLPARLYGEEKLIRIDESHIAAVLPVFFQGIVVGGGLHASPREIRHRDKPLLCVRPHILRCPVRAPVVVEVDMTDPGQAMILDPLPDVELFIFHDHDDRKRLLPATLSRKFETKAAICPRYQFYNLFYSFKIHTISVRYPLLFSGHSKMPIRSGCPAPYRRPRPTRSMH